ncbi:MAG: HlyC/CorC family transporter [Chloroflexi bacterium]|nr:HlyC/CorC family transporter [Chloroflexota bacterium]
MIDSLSIPIYLLIMVFFDALLAATRSAFVNSHPSRLEELKDSGSIVAQETIDVVRSATKLILSMRIFRGLFRVLTIGFALFILRQLYQVENEIQLGRLLLVLLGIGTLVGLIEFLAEEGVLRSPNRWALRLTFLARATIFFTKPVRRVVRILDGYLLGSKGGRERVLVTEEEIMTLVDKGEEGGAIEEEEKAMIYSIFQFGNTLAREVMTPRIDIHALEGSTLLMAALDTLLRTGHSRAPVFDQSIDNVVGLIYIKDLLRAWKENRQIEPISKFIREAFFIPEGIKLDDLLAEMQAKRIHMALVVDEYGGTAGLVTIEDVVEEIVGEIRDEYDVAEEASYQQLMEGEYLFSGGIDLDDVNLLVGSELPKDTSETLGGFIYSQLGRVPLPGEFVDAGGLHLVVEQVTGKRIRKVRASRKKISMSENPSDES